MAGVQLMGETVIGMRRYAQDESNLVAVMPFSDVNPIAYALREARSDNYSSLAAQQPLVKADKVPLDAMRQAIGAFDAEIWQKCRIFPDEISDCTPKKRNPDFKLPRGKDLAVYRGWTVNPDGTVNVAGVEPVYLKNPTGRGLMNSAWRDFTSSREGIIHWPDNLDYSRRNLDGLNAFNLAFWVHGRPYLYSYCWLGSGVPGGGALLGSRLTADEIVERFVKSEPQKPQRSAYELELDGLERHLSDLRSRYNPRLVQEMKQGLINLRRLDSQ